MTGPRSRFESDSAASVTGVAAGGLGTGANLEDTQVFRTEDLAAPAAETAEPQESPAVPTAKPVPVPVASASVAEPIPAPVPSAPVRPTVVPPGASSNRQPGRGLAGLLAAALVVLAGVAFVVSRGDNTLGAGQTVPSAAAPATERPDGAGTGDGGNGDGGGKDKGKSCNGNGNGRGNGCGGDDDDD